MFFNLDSTVVTVDTAADSTVLGQIIGVFVLSKIKLGEKNLSLVPKIKKNKKKSNKTRHWLCVWTKNYSFASSLENELLCKSG